MTPAHRNTRGTTLVEVLVAVAVIGALSAIGIPQYASYTEKGREAQCIANRHNVESASRACTLETGKPCLTTGELVKRWRSLSKSVRTRSTVSWNSGSSAAAGTGAPEAWCASEP